MLDWKEFNAQSKEEWITTIEKELNRSVNIAESLFSYAHREDLDLIDNLIYVNGSQQSWFIRERFFADNPVLANKQILEALETGLQDVFIISSKKINRVQLDELFNNVFIHMLQIHWKGPYQKEIMEFFNEKRPINLLLEWEDIESIRNTSETKLNPEYKSILLRQSNNDDRLQGIIEMFKSIVHILNDENKRTNVFSNPNQISFIINSEMDFVHEIALIRAIRLVYANILGAYSLDPFLYPARIISNIGENADFSDSNTNLIRFTIQAMACVLGGSGSIEIAPSNGDYQDPFRRRISRNIHHILKMESFLHKVIDPAAGSYTIQLATRNYCDLFWNAIK